MLASEKEIEEYINYAVEYGLQEGRISRQKEYLPLATIRRSMLTTLNSLFGKDVNGYIHVLRDNDIRHLLKSPGVSSFDIKNIGSIINDPDLLFKGKPTEAGNNTVYYVQRHNGVTYYVEQAIPTTI